MRLLRIIASNSYLNLLVGLLLLYTSGSEAWDQLQAIEQFQMGMHHGVLLFALLHILRTLPDLFEGIEHIDHANKSDD